MPTTVITPSNSAHTAALTVDSNGAENYTVLVTEGAYAINDNLSVAANPGVFRLTGFNEHIDSAGFLSSTGDTIVTGDAGKGSNSITLAETSSIRSHARAIVATGGTTTISNAGAITADVSCIDVAGSGNSVTNTGTLTGFGSGIVGGTRFGESISGHITNAGIIDVQFNGVSVAGNYAVKNSGSISSQTIAAVELDGADNSLTNSGTLQTDGTVAAVYIASGSGTNTTVINSGTITSAYVSIQGRFGNETIYNSGTLNGAVQVDEGSDTIENRVGGYISGNVDMGVGNNGEASDVGADRLDNYGVITGYVDLGGGTNTLTNYAGATIAGNVGQYGRSGDVDTITNFGFIGGNVSTDDGDDIVNNQFGTIFGIVDLGAGDDTFTGGAGIDLVQGGLGADTITLGAGDDTYFAGYSGTSGDGIDDVDGGDGIDTYDAHLVTANITIDLDNSSTAGGRINNDKLIDFENAIGGTLNDTLLGSNGDNKFWGNAGNDTMKGGDGRDRMFGGSGADTLTGGAGRDILSGGTGNYVDTFVYTSTGDSGLTGSTRDQINDFVDAGTFHDIINLNAIDANTSVAGNQDFSFIATAAFSNVAGQLRYEQLDSVAVIYGDINGDSKADFSIALRGTHTLTASDFTL